MMDSSVVDAVLVSNMTAALLFLVAWYVYTGITHKQDKNAKLLAWFGIVLAVIIMPTYVLLGLVGLVLK